MNTSPFMRRARMTALCFSLTAMLSLLASASAARAQTVKKFVPVTDAMLQKPDPADWLMWRRTLDGWGYSPLDQINRGNVALLQKVWSRPMGPGNAQESTPLVYDGVMYLPSPGDLTQAVGSRPGLIRAGRRRSVAAPPASGGCAR